MPDSPAGILWVPHQGQAVTIGRRLGVNSKIPAPTAAKLEAWAIVRATWKASGKPPCVTPELLDAEYEASLVD